MQRDHIHHLIHQLLSSHPPRVLLVYAHPDDEAIAVGGHLPLFRNALFVQVTDGAPVDNADGDRLGLTRDEYRATRALELRGAFAAAGMPEARHRTLNLPDKEAAFHLAALTDQIAGIFAAEEPEAIFTHPYEGGHADHDACAFAVHRAVAAMDAARPLILESPFYHRAVDGRLQTGRFLQPDEDAEAVFPLPPAQQERKRAAFDAFVTQRDMLGLFNASLREERFRIAPAYDFARPAIAGTAWYESFIPNLSALRFAELATEAMAAQRAAPAETVAA